VAPVVACLHHLEHRVLGVAGGVLRGAGVRLLEHDVRAGRALPDLGAVDGVLSLGGDESVREIARLPALEEEARLLRTAVEAGVPVLGVCLGAQLLAHALGGAVAREPVRLVGWPEVRRLPGADGDPLFGALPETVRVLHWNEDGFTPPPGAVELLSRSGRGGEAFRVGERAWGVQFHPEADAATLDHWHRGWRHQVLDAGVDPVRAQEEDRRHLPAQRAVAEALFGGFAAVVRRHAGVAPRAA